MQRSAIGSVNLTNRQNLDLTVFVVRIDRPPSQPLRVGITSQEQRTSACYPCASDAWGAAGRRVGGNG
jgi:hypothetical protein